MSRLSDLYQWFEQVKHHLPCLSQPQLHAVMLWTAAIVIGGICSLSLTETACMMLTGQSANTVRQRAREMYKDAPHKSGTHRRQLDVFACFGPLLSWIVDCSPGKEIALAIDASAFKDNFTLLCISVVTGGCAIPVAWRVLSGNEKGAWKPHWLEPALRWTLCEPKTARIRLGAVPGPCSASNSSGILVLRSLLRSSSFSSLKNVIPSDRFVIVMADRGLYAKWLFHKIVELGWHPFLRINPMGNFAPSHETEGVVSSFIPEVGKYYASAGVAFRGDNK